MLSRLESQTTGRTNSFAATFIASQQTLNGGQQPQVTDNIYLRGMQMDSLLNCADEDLVTRPSRPRETLAQDKR